jgi:hypothetical protein
MGERLIPGIELDGTISTIAGDGGSGYDGDNTPATQARLTNPTGLAVTPAGDVLIADQGTGACVASAASLSEPTSLLATARVACS